MAIEPIKGFYVHDEVTDTDGVAKYDAGALENLDRSLTERYRAPDSKAVGDRFSAVEAVADEANQIAERLNEGGLELKDEVLAENISAWLNEHPEATTTVEDGALTQSKLSNSLDARKPSFYSTVSEMQEDEQYRLGATAISDGAVYMVRSAVEVNDPEDMVDPSVLYKYDGQYYHGGLTEIDRQVATGYECVNGFALFVAEYKSAYVAPEMFGAKGDGVTDDTIAINNAVENAITNKKVLYFSPKTYLCSTGIVIENPPNIIMDGYIKTNNGTGLTIGKSGAFFYNKFMKLCTTRSESNNQGTTGIKLYNAVDANIEIFDSAGYDIGVEVIGDNAPFAYNTININNIRSRSNSLKFSENGSGYTNENLFLGGRFVETVKEGSRALILHGNNNVFIKPCMENAEVCVECQAARENKVIAARTEGSTYAAMFDAQSWLNDFEIGYGSTAIKDGYINYNTVRYNNFASVQSAGSKFAQDYNNTVFDSGNLNDLITLGNPNTMTAPLYFVTTSGTIKRNPEQAYLSRNENKPNEIVLNGSSFGVFIDCSIAKTFCINQGGEGPGKIVYKIYDIDKQPIDMSTLTPISPEEYTQYYGTGGAFFSSRYPTSTITVPDSAKYVYIGISRYPGNSFYSFNITSKVLATVIKDWTT